MRPRLSASDGRAGLSGGWAGPRTPHESHRFEAIVMGAQEPQVLRRTRAAARDRPDVIHLQGVPGRAAAAVGRPEGALPAISHKHMISNGRRNVARAV
jgi:hypothetical protein